MTLKDYLTNAADKSKRVSHAGLRQFSGIDKAELDELTRLWPQIPFRRRRDLVRWAVELAEDHAELDFSAALHFIASDPDEEVRIQAVEGLWEDEDRATVKLLLNLLKNDPSARVRASAALSLGRFVYLLEVGRMREALGDRIRTALIERINEARESIDVQRRSIESLAYLSEPEVVSIIESAYSDPNPKMRASAVLAMGRSCDERWLEALLGELGSANPEMRFEAARACGEIENQRAVHPLLPLLVDPDREVRLAAVDALGRIGGPVARKALMYCKETGDEEIQAAATEALGSLELTEDPAHTDIAHH